MKISEPYDSEFYGSKAQTVFLTERESRVLIMSYSDVDMRCKYWDRETRLWKRPKQQYCIPLSRLFSWLTENVGAPDIECELDRLFYNSEDLPKVPIADHQEAWQEAGIDYYEPAERKWRIDRSYGDEHNHKITFMNTDKAQLFYETMKPEIYEFFIPYSEGMAKTMYDNGSILADFYAELTKLFGHGGSKPINLLLDNYRWTFYADTRRIAGQAEYDSTRGAVFCFRDKRDAMLFKLKYYG